MRTLKQYFDSQTPEHAALESLVLTLLTEVKQSHIDWYADVLTDHMSFEDYVRNKGGWEASDLYDYNKVKQNRISLITNFTTCIHDPEIHNALIEAIRYDLAYNGVDTIITSVPWLFREDTRSFLDTMRKKAKEAGLEW